jgi:uncharacterized RDD family membrane protein YckC
MKSSVGFFARLIAYFLDKTLIGFIPLAIFCLAWLFAAGSLTQFLFNLLWLVYYLIFLAPLVWWIYLCLSTAQLGTTFGKAIAGLKVVDEKDQRLSFFASLFRYPVGYTVSRLGFFLGFIWILVDSSHRAWHDLFTGTRVIAFKRPQPYRALIVLIILIGIQAFTVIKLSQVITASPLVLQQLRQYQDSIFELFKNLPKPDKLFIEDISNLT